MTAQNYDGLGDAQINPLVAERVMGWTNLRDQHVNGLMSGTAPGKIGFSYVPDYCNDDNAARSVRNRIAELGLIERYWKELHGLVAATKLFSPTLLGVGWAICNATAREQCVAALRVLDTATNEGTK